MKEPCRSCSEKDKDFGGCRCQAYALTGAAENADPVCSKSPHHSDVKQIVMQAQTKPVTAEEKPLLFRTDANSMRYASIPIKEEGNKVP